MWPHTIMTPQEKIIPVTSNPPIIILYMYSVFHKNNIILIDFRYNEYVLPDSFQPAGQSTQLPQGGQSESVSTCSKCKTQFSKLKHNIIIYMYLCIV